MSYFLHLTYRTGIEFEHCCGSRLAAERLAAYLVRQGRISRWEITEGWSAS